MRRGRPPARGAAVTARAAAAPEVATGPSSGVAATAVALAATALSAVLTGGLWFGFVVVTVSVVAVAGTVLRGLWLHPALVALGQLGALTALVTAVFTRSGVLVVFPGPDALRELGSVLWGAGQQVQFGVAPVAATVELLCLVVIAIGLAAVVVDTLVASAGAPATSGLVLLCVVAVPASLADDLLPWWTFVLGALGFALLLTVDGQHRHLVRGEPVGPGGAAGAGPPTTAVGAAAVVVALLTGSMLTAVGTEGRLPRTGPGAGIDSSGIGLNPFTSLRGQLDNGEVVDLFRIRGLADPAYLRALTLNTFRDGQGWVRGPLDGSAQADGAVPLPPGSSASLPGPAVEVQIEPIDYVDTWLPTFGVPLSFRGAAPDWRYDPGALTAFAANRQRAEPYTVQSVLLHPGAAQLRTTGDAAAGVGPEFLDTGGVDPAVATLAEQVTAGADTAFDATLALNSFFTSPGNGFSYQLETAPGNSGDALVDFLFDGRAGYCEQYASAMAIMLRTLGIPARVAVGFTAGIDTGDFRLITTQDAHAWVEAWFPGTGWLPFDPTPLSDGRTVVPPYVAEGSTSTGATPQTGQEVPTPGNNPPADPPAGATPDGADPTGIGPGTLLAVGAVAVLLLAVLAALTPGMVRSARRRRRLRTAAAGGPDAAGAAWEEVLAESLDRGVELPESESVRVTARRLARAHSLDEPGRAGLRALVGAVERSWYGTGSGSDPALPALLDAVRASMARGAAARGWARLFPRSVLPRRR